MTPDPWCTADRHGDRSAYRWGCRCAAARDICAKYQASWSKDQILGKPRSVDSTGTRRRIQALRAIGWTNRAIGAHMGTDGSHVGHWCAQPRVFARTATAVARVYDELSMRPGPSDRSRAAAARAGWPPPLAWDDDTIDDPKTMPVGIRSRARGSDFDDVEMLARSGETWEVAATRLGITREGLERRIWRARRADLASRFTRNSERWSLTGGRNQWSA